MLEKLEKTYLGALRVIILTFATIALVIASLSIVTVIPLIFGQVGFGGSPDGGDLVGFMEEFQPPERADRTPSHGDTWSKTYQLSPSIQESARRVAEYAERRQGPQPPLDEWEKYLANSQSDFAREYFAAYESSLETLTKQLEASKGEPLSDSNLSLLFEWHNKTFEESILVLERKKEEEAASALQALTIAGSAFLGFILLVFCFLAVRIEKNLRLVRISNAEEHEV